ncbi:pentapeptide repeat-containing protein [Coraliomargarita parva]|uniref:pentapeptide repeat-containing protein n=1 Tax=Coraliomargarita parva TaxID=3014050 RepID=UPI0022B5D06D|nr:pentapeptide repeat-containing protein [Coraliomargarita parva]
MKYSNSILSVSALLSLSIASSLSAVSIDANTDYTSSDFSGQSLEASATDLGTTRFFGVNASNTSWSVSGATTTPHFSAMAGQHFRQANLDGADWSGVIFTSNGSGNQYFYQGSFVNTDFSNTVFTLTSSDASSEAFKNTNLSGADFSGASITTTGSDIFEGATMTSSTNFSNATLLLGTSTGSANLASTGGANFSGATLRVNFEGTNLSSSNFQNVSFVSSDGFNSVIRNSIANLTDFRGTDFSGVSFPNWLESLTFDEGMAPLYDDNTIFTTQNGTFDPVAAGWTYSPIPEASSFAMIFGTAAGLIVTLRRRR